MLRFTIAAVFGSLLLFSSVHAAVEISDGSVKALYHLEDEVDSSGNGLNLTNSSAAFGTGKLSNSASISPASDYLANTSVNSLKLATSSLAFWIKSTNSANVCAISQAGSGDYKYGISVNSGKLEVTQYNAAASADRTIAGATTISNGVWYHVVVDMNSDLLRLWINGAYETSSAASLSWNINSNAAFRIGTRADGCSNFVGEIDEFVIVSGNLSTSTRDALYAAGAGSEICISVGCGASSTPSSTSGDATSTIAAIDRVTLVLDIAGTIALFALGFSLIWGISVETQDRRYHG